MKKLSKVFWVLGCCLFILWSHPCFAEHSENFEIVMQHTARMTARNIFKYYANDKETQPIRTYIEKLENIRLERDMERTPDRKIQESTKKGTFDPYSHDIVNWDITSIDQNLIRTKATLAKTIISIAQRELRHNINWFYTNMLISIYYPEFFETPVLDEVVLGSVADDPYYVDMDTVATERGRVHGMAIIVAKNLFPMAQELVKEKSYQEAMLVLTGVINSHPKPEPAIELREQIKEPVQEVVKKFVKEQLSLARENKDQADIAFYQAQLDELSGTNQNVNANGESSKLSAVQIKAASDLEKKASEALNRKDYQGVKRFLSELKQLTSGSQKQFKKYAQILKQQGKEARKSGDEQKELAILQCLQIIYPENKEVEEQITAVNKIITRKQKEKSISKFIAEANLAYSNDDYKKAKSILEKALSIDPEHEEAGKLIDRVKSDLNNAEVAIMLKEMEKQENEKNWEDALSLSTKILAIDPTHKVANNAKTRYRNKIDTAYTELEKLFNGKWRGSYICSGAKTGLDLDININLDKVQAVFNFYPLDIRSRVQSGSYSMTGNLKVDGTFIFKPKSWIKQPRGYYMVGMSGRTGNDHDKLTGRISNNRCGSFELSKINKDAGKKTALKPILQKQKTPDKKHSDVRKFVQEKSDDSSYLGCFRDNGESRDLKGYWFEHGSITAEKCMNTCKEKGYRYAGTQFGWYCFCGNSYGAYGKANNCNVPCRGDRGEICGGSWANSVYSVGILQKAQQKEKLSQDRPTKKAPTEEPPNNFVYLGCYKDHGNRDLGGYSFSSAEMTGEKCIKACLEKGFKIAGTQNSNQCFCGDTYGGYGKVENCTSPCSGNRAEKCGGVWVNSVYRTNLSSTSKEAKIPSAHGLKINHDFEEGNLTGWKKEGNAFEMQPTYGDNPTVRGREPSNHQGDYWIGTYEKCTSPSHRPGGIQGDGPQGTLTSDSFLIDKSKMSYLIGGGCDISFVRVELIVQDQIVLKETGKCTETMHVVNWDVSSWVGQQGKIRLVDKGGGDWGHINFDNLRFY